MAGGCDIRLVRIIVLGFAFMVVFTAFQTTSLVEKSVLVEAKNETNSSFTGDGYTSLATIYGTFAVSNWFAPVVVNILGPRISMVIGSVVYALFIASFLKPMNVTLYVGSVLIGIAAAILWTGQGNYMIVNSDESTMGRNSGISWALLQMSLLIGCLYLYFEFDGQPTITADERTTLFLVLTIVGCVGVGALFLLFCLGTEKKDSRSINTNADSEDVERRSTLQITIETLKKSIMLLCNRDMLLLCVTFAYTGLSLNFFGGVYATCVGNTLAFGNKAKSYLGLMGIFIAVGEIFGGGLFGIFGKSTIKYGRDPIVFLGFLGNMVCFFLTFLNLPSESPLRETNGATYITPNVYVACVCAFLLGLGDSSYNTQAYSIIGYLQPDDSAPAVGIYKFVQSLLTGIAFVYCDYLTLEWQLLILVIFNFAGALCFFVVEWSTLRPPGYSPISQHDETIDTIDA